MPVQKSRKTPSRRGMHRSHDGLAKPALSTDPQSGETHLRHCITPDGFYRGKRVIEKPEEVEEQEKLRREHVPPARLEPFQSSRVGP
jgi:large subunit ribosomal protein L32